MLYKYSNGQNKTFRDGRLLKSIYFFICQTVDNGAMIAGLGYRYLKDGWKDDDKLTAYSRVAAFKKSYP